MRLTIGRKLFSAVLITILAILSVPEFALTTTGLAVIVAAASTGNIASPTPAPVETNPAGSEEPYALNLKIDHSASGAVVIETGRQRRLYDKNADVRINIPAASKMMTALIACERLSMGTMVTISKVAAAADVSFAAPDGIHLETGDKYSLEYLLFRIFFYNSDAAALAIAEQIANVEEDFVSLMNAKAKSLDLNNTVFLNCTGAAVFANDQPQERSTGDSLSGEISLQYSTPSDVARLVAFACTDANFNRVLSTPQQRMLLGKLNYVSMHHELQHIWTLSEGRVTGAFYSEAEGKTYMVAIGAVNGVKIVAITAGGAVNQRYSDLESIFESIGNTYILSPLVEAGSKFSGAQEETVDGELFGLVFKTTVYYVHPVDDLFTRSPLRYNSFGPHSRPIQRSMTVGQVIFELKDGTTIAVDVAPDRQILSSITILDKTLSALQENQNLYIILIAASGVLLLVLLAHVLVDLGKLLHLIQLVILEKRSRR